MKQPSEKYCYECAVVLPRTATVCGSCLAVQPALPQAAPAAEPASAWDATHALLALGAALLVAMAAHTMNAGPPPPARPPGAAAAPAAPPSEDVQAWAEARRLVAAHLRAPRDAAFSSEHNTVRLGPGTYEIRSSLEAFNTHGVSVRTVWTAVVARQDGGWSLQRLDARN